VAVKLVHLDPTPLLALGKQGIGEGAITGTDYRNGRTPRGTVLRTGLAWLYLLGWGVWQAIFGFRPK
jgi:hypothetical protein